MGLGRDTHVESSGIAFARLNAFSLTISQVIINSTMEIFTEFSYGVAFIGNQSVMRECKHFPEKTIILFTDLNATDLGFIFHCVHINLLFFRNSNTCFITYCLIILCGCGLCAVYELSPFLKITLEPLVFPLFDISYPKPEKSLTSSSHENHSVDS